MRLRITSEPQVALPAPVPKMPEGGDRCRGRTGRAGPLALGLLMLAAACAWAACSGGETAALAPAVVQSHDLVIAGGRVIDPETGLDAVRHVGIRDGAVVALSESPLEGGAVVDVAGLVVAPGFIDLHAHGQDPASSRYQAQDGVTTALELEIGAFPVGRWYARRGGASLINYGVSVSHQGARLRALGSAVARANPDGTFSLGESGNSALYRAATEDELARLGQLMERGLEEGGIGFGFGLSYTPGASHREVLRLFELAAGYAAPAFIHLRGSGAFRRGGVLAPFQEVIANAAVTGAALHIVHLNSTAAGRAEEALAMIRGARERGVDVTTEAYPYTASASLIESPLFDGWDGRPAEAYRRLQWVETGERLTRATFDRYPPAGWVGGSSCTAARRRSTSGSSASPTSSRRATASRSARGGRIPGAPGRSPASWVTTRATAARCR